MSGVYIKGMEMPEHCGVCRFAVDGWCYAYGKPNIDALANDGRTNFCPLVPVPPHGDLIERDATIQALKPADCVMGNEPELITWGEIWAEDCCTIDHLPTIIPAEEGE